jgi:hypothetical protein
MAIFLIAALVIGIAFAVNPKIGIILIAPILFGWTLLLLFSPNGLDKFWFGTTGITAAYCGFMWFVGSIVRNN